jgi:hypothetical protein
MPFIRTRKYLIIYVYIYYYYKSNRHLFHDLSLNLPLASNGITGLNTLDWKDYVGNYPVLLKLYSSVYNDLNRISLNNLQFYILS